MATKTKDIKESTPKTAKAKKSPASSEETSSAAESTASKSATKTKSKSKMPSDLKEHSNVAAESPAAELTSMKESPAVQPVPLTVSTAPEDKKWQEIRIILEKLKDDTLREIRKSVKNGTEAVAAIEPGGDIYDQASSERDRELGLLLGDREREKIHSIDEALLRIDEGEYGICEECDEDIPLGRLKAMPFTRHCVKCKSDIEKLQAQTKRVEEERAYREIPLGAEEDEG
ncbi:MAG: TraR/DksA C4-type zinc finger protein [Desulfuromonadaceae bacterium]|nr:TraR/DksA C4-type zinc finger protein [Desulfuromonadaceae bacterium]